MIIYHNPSCSKCASVLSILEERNISPKIIEYLNTPPSKNELTDIVQKLGISPLDLIRKKESIFLEKYAGNDLSDEEWIEAMIENPILIERPIIINGDNAIIGRPPIKILDII